MESARHVRGCHSAQETRLKMRLTTWRTLSIRPCHWGEHIHLGYYTPEVLADGAGSLAGSKVKDFIEAKLDFVDEMRYGSACWNQLNPC